MALFVLARSLLASAGMIKHNRPQRIIRAVPRRYLLDELSPDKLLGETHHANNLIYVVDAFDSPAVMTEIGRLREVAFRRAGGGTGRRVDIDSDDLAPNGYRQMVVWNPYERQIVGGYRFIISHSEWPEHLSTEHYYSFSPRFRRDYLPHTIELGRSFIQPRFQSGRGGLFALDNLWDGMGAVVSRSESVKYLFGKVTVYPHRNPEARQLLYTFLRTQCPATEGLILARESCRVEVDVERYKKLFESGNYQENLRTLQMELKILGESIPPLIKSYINLSATMQAFDTVRNDDFGGVEETAILLTVADISPEKYERHFVQKQKVL